MRLSFAMRTIALVLVALPAIAQTLVPRTQPVLAYPPWERAIVDVTVQLDVDETGAVVAAEVVGREPADASPAFDGPALAFAKALAFEPVIVGGVPTRIRTDLRLHFAPPAPTEEIAPAPATPAPAVVQVDSPRVNVGPTPTLEGHVRSTRVPTSAADFHLHVGDLAVVPRRSAEELLTLAPGILLTNHGGEGHAPAVFLRGFDAGEGQDLEFRLDGVPLNQVSNAHSHGYADTHPIIPELVDELRVIEGPFDPRQADFAVAGTAEYHLALHERGTRALASYGTAGATRGLVLFGPQGESDGTFAGVDVRRGDGYGPSRAYQSASAMVQYEAETSGGAKVQVSGNTYATRFAQPGIVRADDVDAGRMPCASDPNSQFFCTYDTNQGGAVSRHALSARLQRKVGRDTFEAQAWAASQYNRIRENYTGFLLDLPPAGSDQRGDLSEKISDATTLGLRTSWAVRRRAWDRTQELELGLYTRHDDGDSISRRLRAVGGEPYKRDFDVGFTVTNVAGYLAGILRPSEAIILRGGLRLESFGFSLVDRNRPTRDRQGTREPWDARDAFGLTLLPRLSLEWKLGGGTSWLLSGGTGARSSDAAALSDGEFAPFSEIAAIETGLAFQRSGGEGDDHWSVDGRASTFYTHVARALIFDEVTARNILAGETNRLGALVLARTQLGGWLDAQASTTLSEAYQPGADDPWWAIAAGARLPYVPRWVHRLDTSVRKPLEWKANRFDTSAGLGVTFVAPRPLPLGKESDSILTLDASARVTWGPLELGLSVTNLLDSRYRLAEYNYASNFRGADLPPSLRASRHFSAGAPRMAVLSISGRLGSETTDEKDHDFHHDEEAAP